MQELSSFESKNGFGQTALSSGFSLVWKICLTSVIVVPLASSNTIPRFVYVFVLSPPP